MSEVSGAIFPGSLGKSGFPQLALDEVIILRSGLEVKNSFQGALVDSHVLFYTCLFV